MANMLRGMKREAERGLKSPETNQGSGQKRVPEPPPQIQEQIKTVSGALISLAHDEKASKNIHSMLKSGKPDIAIPQAAMVVYQRFKGASKQGKLPLEIIIPSYLTLIDDLLDFGNQAGFFQVTEEESPMVLENSFQLFIETGLKDKSIDPIKLQEAVEPLMNKEQRNMGVQGAQATGVPMEVTPQMATASHTSQKLEEQKAGMLAAQGGVQ